MGRTMLTILAAVVLGTGLTAVPVNAGPSGVYEVSGVEKDDMLKMRAGPGTGYKIILGLPNGTVLRVHDCDQTGSTRWCEVSLKNARSLKGFVSWGYLREQ